MATEINLAQYYIRKAEIEDSLTSDDATKVLSAKQGKALNTAISGKEATSNKVSVWSTGTNLNDTHYPSEKLVKDSLDNKVDKESGKGLFSGSYTDLTDKPSIPDVSGKIDTAGTGLSKTGTTLNHSNSITAVTTAALKKVKFDAQGHITGTGDVAASDLPSHNHGADQVTDTNANNYSNMGSLSSGATQQAINAAINTKLGEILGIDVIKVTDNKGTASASTMNKLYIEVGANSTDVYYTKSSGTGNNITYSWASLDTDILDNITIPTDVSDLTDNNNTQFTPKSHSHSEYNKATYNQTVASNATGAYEIGKITVDGSSTTLYGKDTNTTYSNATQSAAGLMSSTDKKKLDTIDLSYNDSTGILTITNS